MSRRPLLALTLLVAAAWTGAVLGGGLALDDREVLTGNPAIGGSVSWVQVFLRDYWDHLPAGAAGHYRPLATATLRLDQALHGATATGCHLTNVLLHLGAVLLAARLFALRGRALPWVGLALFAVHPALADSVAWISGRTSSVSVLGGLLGVSLLVQSARRGSGTGVALGAGLATLLATLGKEDGVVFAALAAGLALERGRRYLMPALVGCLLGLAAYLAMRHAALGEWVPGAPHAPLAGEPLAERLRLAGGAGLEGLRIALLPIAYPPHWTLADLEGTPFVAALLAWCLWIGALVLAARLPARDSCMGLGLGALSLLPLAQIIPSGELLAPRFLYLPLLFSAPAVDALWRWTGTPRWAVGAGLLTCLPLAWTRSQIYSGRADYWQAQNAWRETAEGWNALGNAHLEEGDRAEAEEAWLRALTLRPAYSRPRVNLATLSMERQEWPAAEHGLLLALGANEANPVAWANLGRVRLELGKPVEAEEAWDRALQLSPRVPAFWRGLGLSRREQGDEDGARAAFGEALRLDPDDRRASALLD